MEKEESLLPNQLLELFKTKVKFYSDKYQMPCAVVVVLPQADGFLKTTTFGEDRVLKLVRRALERLKEPDQPHKAPSQN